MPSKQLCTLCGEQFSALDMQTRGGDTIPHAAGHTLDHVDEAQYAGVTTQDAYHEIKYEACVQLQKIDPDAQNVPLQEMLHEMSAQVSYEIDAMEAEE